MDITLNSAGWQYLLDKIAAVNPPKYVALDLSAAGAGTHSTGGGLYSDGTFDPGAADTGEQYIVSLVLPNAATGIKAGTSSNTTFRNFWNLTEVSGTGITDVGDYAFSYCDALTTVNLPKAETIGDAAFSYCEDLISVSFPEAAAIGSQAFEGCTSLISVELPSATYIGDAAFSYCIALS